MDEDPSLNGKGPQVNIHGLIFDSCQFISFASRGYRLLSQLYEASETVGIQASLENIGAISFGEWRRHPSQCRRLSRAIINTTMILQAIVGDNHDLQSVLNQKKVLAAERNELRCQLMQIVSLKQVRRADFPLEDESDQVVPNLPYSTFSKPHDSVTDKDWIEIINNLPM